jgi:hypothetical protein
MAVFARAGDCEDVRGSGVDSRHDACLFPNQDAAICSKPLLGARMLSA